MSDHTTRKTLLGAGVSSAPSRATAGGDGEAAVTAPVSSPAAALVDSPPTIELRGRRPRLPDDAGGDSDPLIGQELCGYLIRRKLAEGGMGVVYEGVHRKIGRLGATKVLKSELCRSEDMIERFYQEARTVNAIRHEHIVDIHDFGRDPSGRVFFVMEYLEGEPLSARVRRGPLPWSEAFPILDQTLRALKAAHDKGVVHRDLKPDNIWLEWVDGRIQAKLLDFGIAKLVSAELAPATVTRTGSVTGTAHYMSPEQINGRRDLDQRTDVYAMGVIVYEMFVGVPPFVGGTLQAVLAGHLFQDPPRLDALPPQLEVPQRIADVVDHMLVKDPAGRYGSVTDVLADLHDINAGRVPARAAMAHRPRPAGPPADAAPTVRRRRTHRIVIGAFAAAALGGVWLALSLLPPQRSRDVPEPQLPELAGSKPSLVWHVPTDVERAAARERARITLRDSLWQASEPVIRRAAADAFGELADRDSVWALIGLMESDPSEEVRGHAADALGKVEARSPGGVASNGPTSAGSPARSTQASAAETTVQRIARLDALAPLPFRVWYSSGLARLGEQEAVRRLFGYAESVDPEVSPEVLLKAALTLAEVSPLEDEPVMAVLRALRGREATLDRVDPHAGIVLLTKLAARQDAGARDRLYQLLNEGDEGTRLAAADGLAALGNHEGRKVLRDIAANPNSPNQLRAAVVQIALGDYRDLPLITIKLATSDPETQRLAARGLAEMGEPSSLPALLEHINNGDWTVRIAAAVAILKIVGLDPPALARTAIDLATARLRSPEPAVRTQAAGVLPDLPASAALPLLARALADRDPEVRQAASQSAGRMKTIEAANELVRRLAIETDGRVQEQQILALAAIGAVGGRAAHDALIKLAAARGRLGVLAAGSLIAFGDTAHQVKLDAASEPDLRLAAVQAAAAAGDPGGLLTLQRGVVDHQFEIRFEAACGLALLRAEKARALDVLHAALASIHPSPDMVPRPGRGSRDAERVGRAVAALVWFGEDIKDHASLLASLLDAADPASRRAALPIARALSASDEDELLRRLIADLDPGVRQAGVAAIEDLSTKDRDKAIKLYHRLVGDADPVVRAATAGQLSRLLPSPPRAASTATPAADAALLEVQRAVDQAVAAAEEARAATGEIQALSAELAATIASARSDDAAIQRVVAIAAKLDDTAARLEATVAWAEAAARAAASAGGSSRAAAPRVKQAETLALEVRAAARAARRKATEGRDETRRYVRAATGSPQIDIARAEEEIMRGKLDDAKRDLDHAAKLIRASGDRNVSLDFSYAQLYDHMALQVQDPARQHALWQQSKDLYQRFAATGSGPRVQQATQRANEIAARLEQRSAVH